MAELVVDMGSVLAALLAQHHEHVLRIQDVVVKLHKGEVSLDGNALRQAQSCWPPAPGTRRSSSKSVPQCRNTLPSAVGSQTIVFAATMPGMSRKPTIIRSRVQGCRIETGFRAIRFRA